MKISIFARNSRRGYSGGRYHSLLMAEALAQAGHEVSYVTNVIPLFYQDFACLPNHSDVRMVMSDNFCKGLPKDKQDVVILVPSLEAPLEMYARIHRFALDNQARTVLLNFETPNWFNELSPVRRNPSLWSKWRRYGRDYALVLSSAAEGDKYARRYFADWATRTAFTHCHPAINAVAADSIAPGEKQKQIVFIGRFIDGEHKGSHRIAELFCDGMKGYKLIAIAGYGAIDPDTLARINLAAAKVGATFEVKGQLSDAEKFQIIQQSSLLLFPSMFEGFGLPPVEALYCDTPCICFDLPVLREVSGEGLIYVERGNWTQFTERVNQFLSDPQERSQPLRAHVETVARVDCYSKRMDCVVQDLIARPLPYRSFTEVRRLRATIQLDLTAAWIARWAGKGERFAVRRMRGLGRLALSGVLSESRYMKLRARVVKQRRASKE